MIGGAGILLRKVPAELLSRVASGELEVLGSVVRSVSSGRIVGHLQETAHLAETLFHIPGSVPGILGDAIQIAQLEQVKSAIGVVQSLQIANLLLSGASIGVSIASTALVLRRISHLEDRLVSIDARLAELSRDVRELKADRIEEDFSRLATIAEQFEGSWKLSAPGQEWAAVARDAHFVAANFERRARAILASDEMVVSSLPFIDAYAMSSSMRVAARMAMDDAAAAQDAARASAQILRQLGERIQIADLVLVSMRQFDEEMASPLWASRLDEEQTKCAAMIGPMRARELAAASTEVTIEALAREGISGTEWLLAARSEREAPFLFLPAEGDDR